MKKEIFILIVVFTLTSCLTICLTTCETGSDSGTRDEELVYLKAVLPDQLLEMSNLDVASRKSVKLVKKGDVDYLGLHISPSQKKLHGGIRSEVSVDFPYMPGDTVSYEWRVMVPADFITDAPKNRWWVIGQWHDQPNKLQGEKWDSFPSHSPPVVIGLGEKDGKIGFSLGIGITGKEKKQRTAGHVFIKRGTWHHLRIVIHWSEGISGAVSLYLDHSPQPVLTDKGPNMNNAYQHYLKFGMYRHPDIKTSNWMYLDDLKIVKLNKGSQKENKAVDSTR